MKEKARGGDKRKGEVCQLFIEQEINRGITEGKKPADIGRELSEWVSKLFETNMVARTIEQRARRQVLDILPATLVAKHNHGVAKFLTFYFYPGQEEDYDFVLGHLEEHGKRFKQHPHMDTKKLVEILKQVVELHPKEVLNQNAAPEGKSATVALLPSGNCGSPPLCNVELIRGGPGET